MWKVSFKFNGKTETYRSILQRYADALDECVIQFMDGKNMFYEDALTHIFAVSPVWEA
jgi:hypothetical protein